jgi:plastocyanin
MTRKVTLLLLLVAFVLPGCNRSDDGPRRYWIDADAASTKTEKAQYSAFYPGALTVAPGDTLRFRNRSTEAPHTITFGINADRSNQPNILTDAGENPVVVEPCDIDDLPKPELFKCSDKKLKAYDGEGFWNSGFLLPKPAPKNAGPKTVSMKLASDIPAGDYTYVCILHPFMNGQITVIEEGEDRDKPVDARKEAQQQFKSAKSAAREIEEPEVERDGDSVTVAAGWGDKTISFNRFAPATLEVDSGTTVSWENQSPYEPHTVTFEADDDTDPFAPGGVKSGSSYSGGFAHSGLFGGEGTPFEGEFSLTFTKPGEYEYVCLIHTEQQGTVKVN